MKTLLVHTKIKCCKSHQNKPGMIVLLSKNSTCVLWEDGLNSYSVICGCKNLGCVPEVDAFL